MGQEETLIELKREKKKKKKKKEENRAGPLSNRVMRHRPNIRTAG